MFAEVKLIGLWMDSIVGAVFTFHHLIITPPSISLKMVHTLTKIVSSFLLAHQHTIGYLGYSVPQKVDENKTIT